MHLLIVICIFSVRTNVVHSLIVVHGLSASFVVQYARADNVKVLQLGAIVSTMSDRTITERLFSHVTVTTLKLRNYKRGD